MTLALSFNAIYSFWQLPDIDKVCCEKQSQQAEDTTWVMFLLKVLFSCHVMSHINILKSF